MIMKSNTSSLKQIERKSDAVGMKECGIIIQYTAVVKISLQQ